jgi:hypothetical protein
MKLTISVKLQGQQCFGSTSMPPIQLPHETSLQFYYVFNYRKTRQTPSYARCIFENFHELTTTFEVKMEVSSFVNLLF